VTPVETERGLSLLPMCEAGLADATAVHRAAIAIEHATGPVLLVSGGDDRVWPTGRMCEQLVERMAGHQRAQDVTHLHFPSAGHMLFPYKRPSDTLIPALPRTSGAIPPLMQRLTVRLGRPLLRTCAVNLGSSARYAARSLALAGSAGVSNWPTCAESTSTWSPILNGQRDSGSSRSREGVTTTV
jgi:hypothetical protein